MGAQARVVITIKGNSFESLTDEDKSLLKHPMTAGVILFAPNFKNREEAPIFIAKLKEISAKDSFVVCGDFEGGHVTRMPGKPGFPAMMSFRDLGEIYEIDDTDGQAVALKIISRNADRRATFLADLGVNLNLAPVLDSQHEDCPIIGGMDRAISKDNRACLEVAQIFTRAFHYKGIRTTAKHFPDHGLTTNDSHETMPVCRESKEVLFDRVHAVYEPLIQDGLLDVIMTAHVIYSEVDPHHPVTFSTIWHDFIRKELGYRGPIVSDCLSMVGADVGSMQQRAEQALRGCCDFLIMCHQTPEVARDVLDHVATLNLSKESENRLAVFFSKLRPIKRQSNPFLPGFQAATTAAPEAPDSDKRRAPHESAAKISKCGVHFS